jgi:hypothetical protein
MSWISRNWKVSSAALATCVLSAVVLASVATAGGRDNTIEFDMVRSATVAAAGPGCLPNASGDVRVESKGATEKMTVDVQGLRPNTDYNFFVIQVPNSPFGLAWYQGDIETNSHGRGSEKFVGRFSIETFIVAPNTAPAPVVHDSPVRDADSNPPTAPGHTYHLGLWFNSGGRVRGGLPRQHDAVQRRPHGRGSRRSAPGTPATTRARFGLSSPTSRKPQPAGEGPGSGPSPAPRSPRQARAAASSRSGTGRHSAPAGRKLRLWITVPV